MSGKPPRNTETHYSKPQNDAGGKEQRSGRQRKELDPERAKDRAKRNYKTKPEEGRGSGPYKPRAERTERPSRDERPERGERYTRDNNDNRYGDRNDRRPHGSSERPFRDRKEGDGNERRDRQSGAGRTFDRRENADRRGAYGRSDEKRGGRDQRPERTGDRPFKKYVPFEDRKDKSMHLEDGERRPFQDRKRDNNEPRGKRKFGDDRKTAQKPVKENPRKRFENEDFYEDERPFTRSTKWDEAAKAGPMTLNKYLAHSGVSSRRDAAAIVKSGKVKVNGEVVLEPGYRVKPDDNITLDDKDMKPQEKMVYILLNKPKDYITTTDDEKGRKKVMDLVANAGVERLYPVGRLDRQTTGVLLITNDGDLAQKLSHPSYNSKKIYQVTLDRNLTKTDFEKIIAGVKLEDGVAPVDALAFLDKKNEIGIEIHSGRNRIVRRIFESLGYVVEKLDRVVYAGLTKKNVSRGKWRFLTEKEVINLKHFKA